MENPDIYNGIRGKQFLDKIREILSKRGKIKDEYINEILNEKGMKFYDMAFTHKSANSVYNYEFLEKLGDGTVNSNIVWYLSRRFPQINCPEGVHIISRLKINLVSKKTLSEFGRKLDFWDYVSCNMTIREKDRNKTLEDVFESFIGTTQKLFDNRFKIGVGNYVCYNIIKSLFDNVHISLDYEDLYDEITKLKELKDYYVLSLKDRNFGKITTEKLKDNETSLHTVNIYREYSYGMRMNKDLIGKGTAYKSADAEEIASKTARATLNKLGFVREIPDLYKNMCNKIIT